MDLWLIAFHVAAARTSKVRSVPGQKFVWKDFKALPSVDDMVEYADARLQHLDNGSARKVYILTSGKVLKIEVPRDYGYGPTGGEKGQNKVEVELSQDSDLHNFIAKVYDFDKAPDYRWLVSDLVKPFSSDEALESAMGASMSDMLDAASSTLDGETVELLPGKAGKMVEAMVALGRKGVDIGELAPAEQWGTTSSGDIVVLDYGMPQFD